MQFDVDKLEFKAKLSGRKIDFGFIENRKEFFEWCEANGYLSAIKLGRQHPNQEDFYVCTILKPLRFGMKHVRYREHPGWETECNTDGPGAMLVSMDYIAYAWPKT